MAGDITQRLIGRRGGNQNNLGAALGFQGDPGRIEIFRALARKMRIFKKTSFPVSPFGPSPAILAGHRVELAGCWTSADGSGRVGSGASIISHSKVTRISTSSKPCCSAVWMVAGSSARDRKYKPRIRWLRLHSSICAACSGFSVSPQTRAMRQWKNSVSHGSNSQGRSRARSCRHLVTRGNFLTDGVSRTLHHPEMHPRQIFSNDAQSQQLGA